MKKIQVVILMAALAMPAYTQDLIVTADGDSLNCKITKVKTDNIYFTFLYDDEVRSTLLPVSGVHAYQYGYFQEALVPPYLIKGKEDFQHIRFAFNGGFSYNTAKVSENVPYDFRDYVRELKSGFHLGGNITYFFTEPLGFGLKLTAFRSVNRLDNIYLEDAFGNRTYGIMSDKLTVTFIGPEVTTRFITRDRKGAAILSYSLGYMGYSDKKVIIDNYTMTGATLGMGLDLGYEISLSETVSLGFQISLISGVLQSYKWDDGYTIETISLESGEYENLNRIDFSLGLRFGR